MQCNFKKGKNKKSNRNLIVPTISFTLTRALPFGKAVYVCGSIPELGIWDPKLSFRLNWTQTNCWGGSLQLSKGISGTIQFKFITSDWQMRENSEIEWQFGKINRKIQINSLRNHSVYNAKWNKQQIALCLHAHQDSEHFSRYFVSGSIEELGNWKNYKELNPISKEMKDDLNMYFKSDPEFSCEVNMGFFYTLTFSVNLDEDLINYTYLRKGDICQKEMHIERAVSMDGQLAPRGRIKQIGWTGCKYIIDEPEFEHLMIERLTSKLYLATNLKNTSHFEKIEEKHITTIVSINSVDEDYAISNYYLGNLCKERNIDLKMWTVEDSANNKFVNEAREIIFNIENLMINGHRVCLNCSKKLIKSAPIKLLYLTVLEGLPFCQAIELIKSQVLLSQVHCKIAEDVFYIVNNKIFRGKTQIKSH